MCPFMHPGGERPRGAPPGKAALLFALAAALLTAGCADDEPAAPRVGPKTATPEDVRPSQKQLAEAIELSAGYVLRNLKPSGRFVYLRHLDEPRDYGRRYNLVRHAGSLYSMGMYYRRTQDRQMAEAMARALRYLRAKVGPVPQVPKAAAIWSDPYELGQGGPEEFPEAKLGGAALGLAGLIEANRANPGSVPVEELRRLGRFILFMQRDDGSCPGSYYDVLGHGMFSKWESRYAPGESALALAMLYQVDRDRAWLDGAAKTLAWLARRYPPREAIPDHWALLAAEKLLPLWGELDDPPLTGDELIAHAEGICRRMLIEQQLDPAEPARYGSFLSITSCTQTSIRLEGLLAALTYLPDGDGLLQRRMRKAVRLGMTFLLRAQVRSGPHAGAFPWAVLEAPPGEGAEEFNRRRREVRIDYVQHALCAMIRYEAVMLGE